MSNELHMLQEYARAMGTFNYKQIISLLVVVFVTFTGVGVSWACTIGVASGKSTVDERPMIWKTRDTDIKDNKVLYNNACQYKFVGVINAGDSEPAVWQGVNEKGFAILNAQSDDLGKFKEPSCDFDNGYLMRKALGYCATVDEFETLLIRTNDLFRETMTIYAVMDATGAAAIFETANDRYRKFDATDEKISPNGYIVRSNFSVMAGEENNSSKAASLARYERSSFLMEGFYANGKISHKDILRGQMRDFSDKEGKGISIPYCGKSSEEGEYGYIDCNWSICRNSTASTSVFVGVLDGEDPKLSTMWTILGHPATSIAIPYWPIGETPKEANGESTSQLCDISLEIKTLLFDGKARHIDTFKLRDKNGNGILKKFFPTEDRIFAETEAELAKWRKNSPDVEAMLALEKRYASEVLSLLNKTYEQMKNFEPDRGI